MDKLDAGIVKYMLHASWRFVSRCVLLSTGEFCCDLSSSICGRILVLVCYKTPDLTMYCCQKVEARRQGTEKRSLTARVIIDLDCHSRAVTRTTEMNCLHHPAVLPSRFAFHLTSQSLFSYDVCLLLFILLMMMITIT